MAKTDTIDTTGEIDRYHPDRVTLDRQLTERITRAHAAMTAALADILAAVTEAEDAESYWAQGSQTTSEWLAANLRVHGKTARMWSRLAKQPSISRHAFPSARASSTSISFVSSSSTLSRRITRKSRRRLYSIPQRISKRLPVRSGG